MVCGMALPCRSARDLIRGIKVPEYISSIIIPHQQLASVGVGAHLRAYCFYLIC